MCIVATFKDCDQGRFPKTMTFCYWHNLWWQFFLLWVLSLISRDFNTLKYVLPLFCRDCLVRCSNGINHILWNVYNLGKILLALETAIGGHLGVVVGRTLELLNHIDVNLWSAKTGNGTVQLEHNENSKRDTFNGTKGVLFIDLMNKTWVFEVLLITSPKAQIGYSKSCFILLYIYSTNMTIFSIFVVLE